MKFLYFSFLTLFFLSFLINCDTSKSPKDKIDVNLLCYSFSQCGTSKPGVKFGILGDSWTDLLFGVDDIKTLRTHLAEDYNYKMAGATLGGRVMSEAISQGLHYQVIDTAGADIKYMLLSLGGNDLQFNSENYLTDFPGETARRLSSIQGMIRTLVSTGNSYKINKFGGEPMIWIIHGYDYANPDIPSLPNSESCRPTLVSKGFSSAQIDQLGTTFNKYNDMLNATQALEANLRYIDLRGTLGGPPYSKPGFMFDCIHPNSGGFGLITDKYAKVMQGFTNNER
ncbi:MAG: SGNH/GDSL hydrolase family protein [Leptospira sp.]|nr:SGNH/GDSL hydrolase family protein [Leptospira sp.]